MHLHRHDVSLLTAALTMLFAIGAVRPAAAASCENLTSLAVAPLRGTGSVATAATGAPGAFTVPAGVPDGPAGAPSPYGALPAFCRISVTLHPTAASNINAEVW